MICHTGQTMLVRGRRVAELKLFAYGKSACLQLALPHWDRNNKAFGGTELHLLHSLIKRLERTWIFLRLGKELLLSGTPTTSQHATTILSSFLLYCFWRLPRNTPTPTMHRAPRRNVESLVSFDAAPLRAFPRDKSAGF